MQPTHDGPIIELCKLEHTALRRELIQLKWCQVQYFTFAITTSIIIYGLFLRDIENIGMNLVTGGVSKPLLFLMPLGILIPSMWIFLDKAKTISRIVGYHYWLENILLGKISIDNRKWFFHGWENSLMRYRENVQNLEKNSPNSRKNLVDIVRSPRGYIVVAFFVYSAFVVGSCIPIWMYTVLRIGLDGNGAVPAYTALFWFVGVGISCIAVAFTLREYGKLRELLFGVWSDRSSKEKWETIFRSE
jgi:hypothetical protein